MVEIALYGLLGALVAAGVLVVGGQPLWQAIAIVIGTVALMIVLAVVSARSTTPRGEPRVVTSSTGSRHGRRRRR
jgi:hypothetical protein